MFAFRCSCFALTFFVASSAYADLVVNTIADEDTNNASCSLREAITAVNTQANYNGCADGDAIPTWSKITFAIPPNAGEVQTIALASALPSIGRPVFIDATTQSGASCTPVPNVRVQINFPPGADGLALGAGSDGSRIHGLALTGAVGTSHSGLAILSDHATVGCVISGMDASATTALPNTNGIFIIGKHATIGEATATSWFPNLLSGNSIANIEVYFGADDALIAGNYIGVDHTGLTPMQTGLGISAEAAARLHIGTGFADGPPAHQRNVIGVVAKPSTSSVDIYLAGSSDAVIAGNYIGVGVDGHTLLPIGIGGNINVDSATNTLIGCNGLGSWDDCRNVMADPSDGTWGAMVIGVGGGSTGTAIVSNFINVAADGITSLAGSSTQNEGIEAVDDVLVARNLFRVAYGVDINLFSSSVLSNPALAGSDGAPLNSTDNCFADVTSIGVNSANTTLAFDNWWGAANGPAPTGSGASAAAGVYTVPFLAAPSPYCGFDHIFTNGFDG